MYMPGKTKEIVVEEVAFEESGRSFKSCVPTVCLEVSKEIIGKSKSMVKNLMKEELDCKKKSGYNYTLAIHNMLVKTQKYLDDLKVDGSITSNLYEKAVCMLEDEIEMIKEEFDLVQSNIRGIVDMQKDILNVIAMYVYDDDLLGAHESANLLWSLMKFKEFQEDISLKDKIELRNFKFSIADVLKTDRFENAGVKDSMIDVDDETLESDVLMHNALSHLISNTDNYVVSYIKTDSTEIIVCKDGDFYILDIYENGKRKFAGSLTFEELYDEIAEKVTLLETEAYVALYEDLKVMAKYII